MVPLRKRSSRRYRIRLLQILSLSAFGTGAFLLGGWLAYTEVLNFAIARPEGRATPAAGLIPGLLSVDFPSVDAAVPTPKPAAPKPAVTEAIAPTPPALPKSEAVRRPVGRGRYRAPIRNPGHGIPASFRGKIVRRVAVAPTAKVVALTFDDGPWPSQTEKILEILQQFNAPATFFVTGVRVRQMPAMTRRLLAEGHAIGNHTWNHPDHQVSPQRAVQEIEQTRTMIQQATGIRPVLYRPPGGNLRTRMVEYVQQRKEAVVMWSVDTKDYLSGADRIVQTTLQQVKPGAIILMHDGGGDRTATMAALPQILSALKQQGYRFVTVPQLLEMQKQQ